MANLQTTYAGLKLRNPFIISSSGLTSSVERIRKLDSLGAGAIVLKSLFEEQILFEVGELLESSDYPEALDYVKTYTTDNQVNDYLTLIRDAKKASSVPVIASVNCVSGTGWLDFTTKIEEAGADAVEINIFVLPIDKEMDAKDYEIMYFEILDGLRKRLSIPVIFKIGSQFTNPTYIVNQLYYRKASAVVLFNRFYAPDINLEDMSMASAEVLSSPADIRNTLRWIGIISSQVNKLDISASTGVHSGEAAIKLLLAGATTVQLCSVLYKNGIEYLTGIIDKLESWMIQNQYRSIDEFRGSFSYRRIEDPTIYERAQFMKYFSKYH